MTGIIRPAGFVHLYRDNPVPGPDEPPSEAPPLDLQRNAVTFSISREEAIAYGLIEPTPEEAAALAEKAAKLSAERAEKAARVSEAFATVLAAATAETDPAMRAVLALHAPDERHDCKGCDSGDYATGPAGWPCTTIETYASARCDLRDVPWWHLPRDIDLTGWPTEGTDQ